MLNLSVNHNQFDVFLLYYVYIHWINDGKSVYVGKGKNYRSISLKDRNKKHLNYVNKYGCHVEHFAYFYTEKAAFIFEIAKIAELRLLGLNVLNMTPGGEDPPKSYGKKSSNFCKKLAKIANEDGRSKKVICLETKVIYPSIREAFRLTGINSEAIRKCASGQQQQAGNFIWRFIDDQNHCNDYCWIPKNTRKKRILCIETNQIFNSISEAARSVKGLNRLISQNAKGISLSAYGYTWRYINKNEEIIEPSVKRIDKCKKRIKCLEKNLIFESVREAAIWCKVGQSGSIIKSARSTSYLAHGFTWRYVDSKGIIIPADQIQNRLRRKVICLETKEIFNCLRAAEQKYPGVGIKNCINGVIKKTKIGLTWRELDENNQIIEINYNKKPRRKKVLCVETGEVFESISKAKQKYSGDIGRALNHTDRTSLNFHWISI